MLKILQIGSQDTNKWYGYQLFWVENYYKNSDKKL